MHRFLVDLMTRSSPLLALLFLMHRPGVVLCRRSDSLLVMSWWGACVVVAIAVQSDPS